MKRSNKNFRISPASRALFFAAILLLLAGGGYSQAPWVRIESENRDISFAVPAEYLVAEERAQFAKTKTVSAFEGGVNFEISASDLENSRGNLGRIMVDGSRKPSVLDFELDGVFGKMVAYSDHGYHQTIYLSAKKGYYVLHITAASKDAPEVGRFLRSIRIKGKPIVDAASGPAETEAGTIGLDSLKVSPEVKEALDRKAGRSDRKITFEPLSAYRPCRNDMSARPAFIVAEAAPEIGSMRPTAAGSGELRMNIQMLASGQVGDIVVFSDLEKNVLRAFAEAAAKTRFIPAKLNGVAVDHCETLKRGFGVTRGTRIFSSPK